MFLGVNVVRGSDPNNKVFEGENYLYRLLLYVWEKV